MKHLFRSLALLCALIIAVPATAATFGSGEFFSLDDGVTISDDVYAAGANTTIASDIDGDLTTAGGRVVVTGAIAQDVLAAGGSVSIHSDVGDDIRVAGGDVTIDGTVAGDLVVAGGSVQLLPGATVSGDVIATGGTIALDGDIDGDVRIHGGVVQFGGAVNGRIDIKSADRVTFTDTARIEGDVVYAAPQEADIADGAVLNGSVTFNEAAGPRAGALAPMLAAIAGVFFLGRVAVLVVTALAVFYLFRRFSERVATTALERFGSGTLIGLSVLAATPVLVFLLLASVFGIGVGVLAGIVYVLALALAKVYAGVIAAAALSRFSAKEVTLSWLWIIVGVVALEVITLIPIVGWLVGLLFMLAALGTLARVAYTDLWQQR